jgi:Mg2+ and Co2+ transporter CorA
VVHDVEEVEVLSLKFVVRRLVVFLVSEEEHCSLVRVRDSDNVDLRYYFIEFPIYEL